MIDRKYHTPKSVSSRNFARNKLNNYLSFKNSLMIGDVFYLPTFETGVEDDPGLPEIQKFVVTKFYPYTVMLEHRYSNWKGNFVHRYCPDYRGLFQLVRKIKRNNPNWRINLEDKEE